MRTRRRQWFCHKPGVAGAHQGLEKARRSLPPGSEEALLAPVFWTFGLQSGEGIISVV